MDIGQAKFRVFNKNPFFGSILFNLPVKEDERVGTLGVDGNTLYYAPSYWKKLNSKQQMAALMHEAGHIFLHHIWRGKNLTEVAVNPKTGHMVRLFNIAGDFVINLMISYDTRFELHKTWMFDKKYEGWTSEKVYYDLIKKIPKMSKQQMQELMDSQTCDKSKWGQGSGKEKKEQEEKWGRIIKSAAETAKSRGFQAAYLDRYFEELEPKEDWRNTLREYAQPFRNDYSFNPADRRFLGSDDEIVLPDIQDGEKIDWIAIAIDTSGSIGQKKLSEFLGEVKGIMESYDSVKVKVTFCDAAASPFTELTEWDQSKLKVTGGGGTDFRPVFELVKKEETLPLALLYMTDLQGDFPESGPDFDTLWIATTNDKVPFGRIIPYEL